MVMDSTKWLESYFLSFFMSLLNSQVLQKGFNIAWIAGGPPLLDAFVLGQEASRNLGLLLNQLWAPESSALPDLAAIVLVNRYVSYGLLHCFNCVDLIFKRIDCY
jgi:hypothetical protein